MASSFGKYQSGIEASTGNLVPAYAQMAQQTANAIAGFGQNLSAGIQKYQANNAEAEMIDQEAKALGGQLQQFHSIFGNNPEYTPFAEQLNEYVDKLSKIPEMSLAQKRGALNGAKVAFSQIGTQLQMFNMIKDENLKRGISEGISNTPTTEKVTEDLAYKSGKFSLNSNESLLVQRGKFAESVYQVGENDPNKKIDLSKALAGWDAGARESLKRAEASGNPTATVMLEQLNAYADKRKGEEYRANLKEGEEIDEKMYNLGRMGNEKIYVPSAEELMKMRGTTEPQGEQPVDLNINQELEKLKTITLSARNEQLNKDIVKYDNQIKALSAGEETLPINKRVEFNPATLLHPFLGPALISIPPINKKSKVEIAETRIKEIESLLNKKKAAFDSIEQNKQDIQQVKNTVSKTTEPSATKSALSIALPAGKIGTEEKEYALSEQKIKDNVRNWVTENMGVTKVISNPDGTTSTVKLPPANFEDMYRKLKPVPETYTDQSGFVYLRGKDGEWSKIADPAKGLTRKDINEQMQSTFGNIPTNETESAIAKQYDGLVPEEIETLDFINSKNTTGTTGSGIYMVGTFRGKNYDEFRKNAVGLVQAKSGLEELKRISEKPAETLSFDDRNRAKKIQTYIMADMKTDIVGTQVTEEEWKRLEEYISNPTKIFTIEGAERRGYDVVLMKLNSAINNLSKGTGVKVIRKGDAGQSTQQAISQNKVINAVNRGK
jgi:hypothetical protein